MKMMSSLLNIDVKVKVLSIRRLHQSFQSPAEEGASSATELAGLAVSIYDEEKKKEELGPLVAYQRLLEAGKLRADDRQKSTVMALEHVYQELISYYGKNPKSQGRGITLVQASKSSNSGGWWSSIFSGDKEAPPNDHRGVKGLYMYGGVGCGKTMLMDMFAHSIPSSLSVSICVMI